MYICDALIFQNYSFEGKTLEGINNSLNRIGYIQCRCIQEYYSRFLRKGLKETRKSFSLGHIKIQKLIEEINERV